MVTLPLGLATDLAVLTLTGSTVTDKGDHLVVRTPSNPGYHWGNAIVVRDVTAVNDAARWTDTSEAEFPEAEHRAIGLAAEPDEPEGWRGLGYDIEHEDVLSTTTPPEPGALSGQYRVRAFSTDDDWDQALALQLANHLSAEEPDPAGLRFVTGRLHAKRAMTAAGHAAYFGAFDGRKLVGFLGIVHCPAGICMDEAERIARYQDVLTHPAHRRRGITSHLLGVAAHWVQSDAGSTRWVIVADAGGGASRLYRSRGFTTACRTAQAYRADGRPESET